MNTTSSAQSAPWALILNNLGASLSLSAVAAIYMTWSYLKSFYGDLGVPITMLGLQPHEVLLGGRSVLLLALSPLIAFVFGQLSTTYSTPLTSSGVRIQRGGRVAIAISLVVLLMVLLWRRYFTDAVTIGYVLILIALITLWRGGGRNLAVDLASWLFFFTLFAVPTWLGSLEARGLLTTLTHDPEFPLVSVMTTTDIGLPGIAVENGHQAGPLILLAEGKNFLFLSPKRQGKTTYAVPKEVIASLTFLQDADELNAVPRLPEATTAP